VVLRLEAVRALAQLSNSGKAGQRATAQTTLARLCDTDDSVQVRRAAVAALGEDPSPTTVPPDAPPAATDSEPAAAVKPDDRPREGPTPSHVVADEPGPMPSQPRPRLAGRPDGLHLAGGLLVLVSVLLAAVAVYGIREVRLSEDWYHNLIWMAQLVGAGLLLATRRARWAWFLLGVLAWAWVDLAPTLHSSSQNFFQDAWGFMVTADLTAIAAQLCLLVAVTRDRAVLSRLDWLHGAAAVLLAALAVATNLLLAPLFYEAWRLDTSEGGVLRAIAGIACAAAIPAAVLAPRDDRAATLLSVGWLVGGAEIALTASINLSRYGTSDSNWTKVTIIWILVLLTAAAAVVSSLLLNRSGPMRPPP
jgi:hypothetical protein